MEAGLPRMSLHQRLQHAVLLAAVAAALLTATLLGGPGGLAHLLAGAAALLILLYHALYIAVRAYVETHGWGEFPMRPGRADLEEARGLLRLLFGGGAAVPARGEYRASQKALYWWTAAALAGICASGVAVEFWEDIGLAGAVGLLPTLAALHRGLALLLAAAVLWHLYGVLVWKGRWSPEWSWATGWLDAPKAEAKLPGAWRRHLDWRRERDEAGRDHGEEQRTRERQLHERQEVEAELEKGNSLALAQKYVEALYHYRRALELYPGYSQARYNMARVLTRMGERTMALEAYRAFLAADPFHPLAQRAQEAVRELEREERAR